MGRTIITKRDIDRQTQVADAAQRTLRAEGPTMPVAASKVNTPDTYRDRLLKYIPAEIVAIYLALLNMARTAPAGRTQTITVDWIIFWIILIVTVPWQRRILKIQKWQQVAVGSCAFVIWAVSLGDPFSTSWAGWYQPLYGTMALMLYTFLIPLFEPES